MSNTYIKYEFDTCHLIENNSNKTYSITCKNDEYVYNIQLHSNSSEEDKIALEQFEEFCTIRKIK